MQDPSVQRVLVYRLGSLGDMLIALPALRLMRHAFPRAEIRLLTNSPVNHKAPAAAAVLEGSGLVSGYFCYEAGTRNVGGLLRLMWTLRRWKPQVVVYLAAARGIAVAQRDRHFFRWCGVRRFVGVPLSPEMQANYYGLQPESATAQRLFAEENLEPEAARLARNIAELGDARLHEPGSWDLGLSATEREAAERTMTAAIGPTWPEGPVLAVSVGTKVQAKDWGRENWRALLSCVAKHFPEYALLLVGATDEAETSQYAAEGWTAAGGGPVLNLCGRLTPRESAATMGRARLFVGHDSGPLHLAASMGVPCVGIFAARNIPRQWFPFGERHRILYHRVDCMGCGLETCVEQRKKCLLSISVEEVFEQVQAALRSHATGSPRRGTIGSAPDNARNDIGTGPQHRSPSLKGA